MSDTEGTGGSDTEDVMEFRCRKCPGKTFTAAEKDAHRNLHRQEKEKKKKPGPKSKTRSSRAREPSPVNSELTLFQPVPPAPQKSTGKRRRKDDGPTPASKRKSKKNYDDTAIGNWATGTGA